MIDTAIKRRIVHPLRNAYRRYQARQTFRRHVRPTDVFLVGHPKSGNTWLTLMLGVLVEKNSPCDVNVGNIGQFAPSFHHRDLEIARHYDLPDPRLFRNENPLYPDLFPKTIYILRDPRAAYVSYYHHCVHDTGRTDWDMDAFVEEMLRCGCIKSCEPHLVRWDRHVAGWLERSKRQPVFFAKYEEMKQDSYAVLKQAAEFIGLSCTDADLKQAVDRGQFKNMRRDEVTYGAAPYRGTRGEGGFFARKGRIDSWKDELSSGAAAHICREFAPIMRRVNYA